MGAFGLGLIRNTLLGAGALAGGTAYLAPELVGQDAKTILNKDGDLYEIDPKTDEGKVERSKVESFFDNLFRRTEDIQKEGKKRYAGQSRKLYQQLDQARPGLIDGSRTRAQLAKLQNDVLETDGYVNRIIGAGGANGLTKTDLQAIPTAQLASMANNAERDKLIRDQTIIRLSEYNDPFNRYERDRAEAREAFNDRQTRNQQALALEQLGLQSEELRSQRKLDNRRQDLKEYELRLNNARQNRKDTQLALMTIMKGLAEMGSSITA